MTIFGTDIIDERTKRPEAQLTALDAAIEKLKKDRDLEFSILELLESI